MTYQSELGRSSVLACACAKARQLEPVRWSSRIPLSIAPSSVYPRGNCWPITQQRSVLNEAINRAPATQAGTQRVGRRDHTGTAHAGAPQDRGQDAGEEEHRSITGAFDPLLAGTPERA